MPPDADGTPRARIAVGTVLHARRRPRAHAFRYPALFLRLPMRSLDASLRGQCLLSHNRFNLFSFVDADHGERDRRVPLVEWIDGMLRGEGVVDADGDLWLQTFPRVFGYAFKPVSFWFCHRRDGALRAVVCEVNNTFGERHCYLLAHPDGRTISPGEEMTADKIFHVSPFCDVAGRYRFRFLTARDRVVARVDYDDATGPLLSTSISGTPRLATTAALFAAFARSPLFSFGVVARIHWQAVRLWIKRTPFFSKPAAPIAEVSR